MVCNITIHITDKGLSECGSRPTCIHVLDIPELVHITLYKQGVERILTVDGENGDIMRLAGQVEWRVTNTARIALNFLDSVGSSTSTIKPDSWHSGDTPKYILFKAETC